MSVFESQEFIGKQIVSQDGVTVGELHDIQIDTATWSVTAIEVRLERDVLDRLHLKKPMFGTQTVRILTAHVSGVSDTIVLKHTIDKIDFLDAKEAPDSAHG